MRRALAGLSILLIVAGVLWGVLLVWRDTTGPHVLTVERTIDSARASVVFAPGGARFAYLAGDEVRTFDLASGPLPSVARAPQIALAARDRQAFRFLPSGELAVALDRSLLLVDPRTGRPRRRIDLGFPRARLLDVAPDGRTALVGDLRTLAGVDLARGVVTARWRAPVLEGAILLEGGRVAAGLAPRYGLVAWRTADGRPAPVPAPAAKGRALAWSVAADRTRFAVVHNDGVARFRRWPDGRAVAPDLMLGLRGVGRLEYFPERDLLVARGILTLGRRRSAFTSLAVDLGDRLRVRRFVEPRETLVATDAGGRLAYLYAERFGVRPDLIVEDLRSGRVWTVDLDARLRTRMLFDPSPARAAFAPDGAALALASGGAGAVVRIPR